MSTPLTVGNFQIRNRFIYSATHENSALETGEVTDRLVGGYQSLAEGEAGLIIPGHMYVHRLGKAVRQQTGIHSDDMISGLTKLADAVPQSW